MDCVIGIDGGGTRSTGLCVDLSGRVLAQAEGGALNYHAASLEEFREHLARLLKTLFLQNAGARAIRFVIGTASLFTYASNVETQRACQSIVDPADACLLGDALTGLYGATGGRPGVLVIAGTGSIAVSLTPGQKFQTSGGFGPLIGGDPGSAFWLASQAILAAGRAGPAHALTQAIGQYFGVDHLNDIVPIVYGQKEGCRRLAGLAEFLAQREPMPLFLHIQEQAGQELSAITAPLLTGELAGIDSFFVSGAVLQHNSIVRAALQTALQRALGRSTQARMPEFSAAAGAALLALEQSGTSVTGKILETLRSTSR